MISILLVEDDEKLSKLFYTVLSKQGFNVHIASNGVEGFDILENNHIDLIISDIMMPQMNGYDFTENVRKINEEIPILIPAILIPACASSSPAFLMMYSAYKLNKQSDNIQP